MTDDRCLRFSDAGLLRLYWLSITSQRSAVIGH